MRSLVVVAICERGVNRFTKHSLMEALNLKDFLEETGEFRSVSVYEQDSMGGCVGDWAELKQSPP